MKFTELKLDDKVLEAISYMGYEDATPIQEQVIPVILENKDLIACAQTGTGKTAAFVLPILNKLVDNNSYNADTLIIVPTRELAVQIEQEIQGFSYFVGVESIAVYGGGDGNDWVYQKKALQEGTHIVVATPGKLLSHLINGYVNFKHIKHLILDEADRMLDMGFIDDLLSIISYLPKNHQTLMFSATMPKAIRQFARKISQNPVEISLSLSKPAEGVNQVVYLVYEEQKIKVIKHLLDERKNFDSIIIFTSTKAKVSEIVRELNKNGFKSKGISSNLEQEEREEVLSKFRAKTLRILVATDVVSRGIDIKDLNMVINYDVPGDAEDYVHRVGRTARANTEGEAVTFVIPKEMYKFRKIEELIDTSVTKLQPPEKIGKGPEWQKSKPKFKKKKKPFFKNNKKTFKSKNTKPKGSSRNNNKMI